MVDSMPHDLSTATRLPFGELLRQWRSRRRLSQLDLAGDAEISTRHLSFIETGRAQPSRQMVLRLADRLDLPLRERNRLLDAAGYAPLYAERPYGDPALEAARGAVDRVLEAMLPCPALAIDRHWQLVAHNRMVPLFFAGIDPALLAPPINVLRVSLHPQGLAPRILNLPAWRAHLLHRLARQVELSVDPVLQALLEELRAFPGPAHADTVAAAPVPADLVATPMKLTTEAGTLSFYSTTTIFGTPVDITLSELAIEAFFPADAATGVALRRLAEASDTDD